MTLRFPPYEALIRELINANMYRPFRAFLRHMKAHNLDVDDILIGLDGLIEEASEP